MQIVAVVLAGGLSRRMGGGDKTLHSLAGKPMLAHITERLSGQVERIAINANGDPARFAEFGLPVVPDPVAGFPGPLAGILAAMKWASSENAKSVLTVPGDTPFLPRDLLARLTTAARADDEIAVAMHLGNIHPVVALWPVNLQDDLTAFLVRGETRRVRDFIDSQRSIAVDIPQSPESPDISPFHNINSPHELAFLNQQLGRKGQ